MPPIIYRVAKKYIRKFPFLKDEILSAASWGYVRSYRNCPHDNVDGYVTCFMKSDIRLAISKYLKFKNAPVVPKEGGNVNEEELEIFLPQDREVLKLRLSGYTVKEIAEQLGVTYDSVSWQLRRIRKTYRERNGL